MSALSDRRKGLVLAVVGALWFSPDGLFIRLIEADAVAIVFWRSVFMALALGMYILAARRDEFTRAVTGAPVTTAVVSFLLAVSNWLFVLSIIETTVANTLVILSTIPLFSAILSRLFLGERIHARTAAAIVVAIAGTLVIFHDSLSGDGWLGVAYALANAILMAVNFVLIRRIAGVSALPAVWLSAVLAAVFALPLIDMLAVGARDLGLMAVNGAVIYAVAFSLTMTAPRFLPAAEVGLIMLLESIAGPLWVWLAIGEEPSAGTLIGGAMILGTLAVHEAIGVAEARRGGRDQPAAASD